MEDTKLAVLTLTLKTYTHNICTHIQDLNSHPRITLTPKTYNHTQDLHSHSRLELTLQDYTHT